MQRVCFTFEIYEGMEDEYQKRHDEIWPEMVLDIQAAGYRNYSLFRRGTQVVGYFEAVPDAKTAAANMSESKSNAKWAEWFKEVIVNLTDTKGILMEMKDVWHLD